LDLRAGDFRSSVARNVCFRDLNLAKADFRNAELSETEFVNSDLRGADFRGAVGYSLDIRENKVEKAKFSLPEATALLRGWASFSNSPAT